jgi:hypothetical protein
MHPRQKVCAGLQLSDIGSLTIFKHIGHCKLDTAEADLKIVSGNPSSNGREHSIFLGITTLGSSAPTFPPLELVLNVEFSNCCAIAYHLTDLVMYTGFY